MAVNLAPLMPSVNFSTTTLAILAVGAAIVTLVVIWKCAVFVICIAGDKVYYAGQFWDKDHYHRAMIIVNQHIKSRNLVDAESRNRWREYQGMRIPKRRKL